MSVEAILKEFLSEPDSLPYMIHESAFIEPSVITFSQDVRDACEANLRQVLVMSARSWKMAGTARSLQELRSCVCLRYKARA